MFKLLSPFRLPKSVASLVMSSLAVLGSASALAGDPESAKLFEFDAFAQNKVKKEFLSTNRASRWNEKSIWVYPKSGFVQYALGWKGGTDPSEPVAIKLAQQFIVENARFLGVDAEHLDKLSYQYGYSIMGNVVAKATRLPYPGYEEMKEFTYDVEILLKVRNNHVVALTNRNTRLSFELGRLDLKPKVEADSTSIRGNLVGRELTYQDKAGKTQSAGWIAPPNLGTPQLVIHAADLGIGNGTRVVLAWRYEVVLRNLSWTFFYDAHSGELVTIRQNFST